MAQRKTAVRSMPHVEVLGPADANLPALSKFVSVGKIPGEIKELPITGKVTIKALFLEIGIDVSKCEIQRNGLTVSPSDIVNPGDTVLAISRIRGN